jgi:hypothetical protein
VTSDGVEWVYLTPDDFYITETLNTQNQEIVCDTPAWNFEATSIKAVRLRLKVEKPQLNVGIGHFFYLDTSPTSNPDGTKKDSFYRIDGDDPPADDPTYLDQTMDDATNKISRRLEVLDGWRWSISLRDITYFLSYYVSTGEASSVTTNLDKEIDRLSITVNENLPTDTSTTYYISADGGRTWTGIFPANTERDENDTDYLPTVIAYNNYYPSDLAEDVSIQYVETVGKADKVKLKVVMNSAQSSGKLSLTPELIDYTITIVLKE